MTPRTLLTISALLSFLKIEYTLQCTREACTWVWFKFPFLTLA